MTPLWVRIFASWAWGPTPTPRVTLRSRPSALELRSRPRDVGPVLRFGAMPTRKTGAQTPSQQVRGYLAALPPDARRHLRKLRLAIHSVAPRATEHFSYGIPGFRLNGKALVWYAAWKTHCSMYPIGDAIRRDHAKDLSRYKTSKGTVQFSYTDMPSAALVKRLVKARIAQMK